jgi:hypothetical protein
VLQEPVVEQALDVQSVVRVFLQDLTDEVFRLTRERDVFWERNVVVYLS